MEDHDLEMIALTMGGEGSRLYTKTTRYEAAPSEALSIVDTVGAGDAFTSILAAGYLAGWEGDRILETATRFASAICEIEGAIPDHTDFYGPFRSRFQ
jgi:fructokinase